MCRRLEYSKGFDAVYALEDAALFFSWLPPIEI